LKKATEFLEIQIKATGYLCPIDAAIEQVNYWYPGIIKKRPIEDYGIQLELDLPNWDKSTHKLPPSEATGLEEWNDYEEEEEEIEDMEEYGLPF